MEPPPASTTDQLTAVLEVPFTVAVKVRSAPVFSNVEEPETVTVTLGSGGTTLPPFPLLQPAMQMANTIISMFLVCMVSSLKSISGYLLSGLLSPKDYGSGIAGCNCTPIGMVL